MVQPQYKVPNPELKKKVQIASALMENSNLDKASVLIEELVSQSREHLASHQPAEPVDHTFMTLLAIGGFITLVYMLIS